MPIVWEEATLGTGMSDIDEQHREWIRRFNEFDNAVASGRGTDALFNTLAFLVQYTETHFSFEEDRMEACGCPALAANRLAHDHFRIRLDEILGMLEQSRPTLVDVLVLNQELGDWLTNHISTIDVQLRGCK
jgi:hemerythrin